MDITRLVDQVLSRGICSTVADQILRVLAAPIIVEGWRTIQMALDQVQIKGYGVQSSGLSDQGYPDQSRSS